VIICPACGRSRQRGTGRVRCECIPDAVWREPEMIDAVQRLDMIAVIRSLRRCLSQTEMARMLGRSQSTVSDWESSKRKRKVSDAYAVEAFDRLGVPGRFRERSWQLPHTITVYGGSLAERDAVVVIGAPIPVQVRAADHPAPGQRPVAVLAVDAEGLVVVVTAPATWVTDARHGRGIVRIGLEGLGLAVPVPPRSAQGRVWW